MKDQVDELEKRNIKACFLGSAQKNSKEVIEQIINNEFNIIYMSPEYLVKYSEFLLKLIKDNIILLAIDEAHCIFNYGADFRPSYRLIHMVKTILTDVPLFATTATATPVIQKDIIDNLKLNEPFVIVGNLYITSEIKGIRALIGCPAVDRAFRL